MNQHKFIYSSQAQYYFLIKFSLIVWVSPSLDNFKITFYHFRIIVFNTDGLPIEINVVWPFRATPKFAKSRKICACESVERPWARDIYYCKNFFCGIPDSEFDRLLRPHFAVCSQPPPVSASLARFERSRRQGNRWGIAWKGVYEFGRLIRISFDWFDFSTLTYNPTACIVHSFRN